MRQATPDSQKSSLSASNKATIVVSCQISRCDVRHAQVDRVEFKLCHETLPRTPLVPPSHEPLHAIFYPPTNPAYNGLSDVDEKPPCILNVLGGLTGMSIQGLGCKRIYFSSRVWLGEEFFLFQVESLIYLCGWNRLDVNDDGSLG